MFAVIIATVRYRNVTDALVRWHWHHLCTVLPVLLVILSGVQLLSKKYHFVETVSKCTVWRVVVPVDEGVFTLTVPIELIVICERKVYPREARKRSRLSENSTWIMSSGGHQQIDETALQLRRPHRWPEESSGFDSLFKILLDSYSHSFLHV